VTTSDIFLRQGLNHEIFTCFTFNHTIGKEGKLVTSPSPKKVNSNVNRRI